MMCVRQYPHFFTLFLPHGSHILLLPSHFDVIHVVLSVITWFSMNEHTQSGIFSHPSSTRAKNSLSHNNPANGCPCRLRSKKKHHRIFNTFTMIFSICVVEDVSKHLDILIWEFWTIWEHPPIFLSVGRYCISCLFVTIWQSCNNIHNFCDSRWDAEEPCSLNTA